MSNVFCGKEGLLLVWTMAFFKFHYLLHDQEPLKHTQDQYL